MANTGASIKPEAVREVAFGDVTASYVQMGATFGGPIRILIMSNDSDADMYLSLDGTTNHFRLKANSFKLLDFKTNDAFIGTGDAIYLKQVSGAPTSGTVYVEAMYT